LPQEKMPLISEAFFITAKELLKKLRNKLPNPWI
jgi:hypothetical protein